MRFPALLLSAALAAAACGTGDTSAPPGATSGATDAPSSSEPSTPPAAGGSINVLSLWGGSEEEAFKAVLADFTAKTGVEVNYEADRQTYAATLQARITGGNPPDIATIWIRLPAPVRE